MLLPRPCIKPSVEKPDSHDYIKLINLKEEVPDMKKRTKMLSLFLALILLAFFSFGCAGASKDAKVRCPTCGAVFTIDEGLSQYQKTGM